MTELAEGVVPELSVVVPMHNEAENVLPLYDELIAALRGTGRRAEILVIDDGSADGTFERLREVHGRERGEEGAAVKVLRLRRRFGKSAALGAHEHINYRPTEDVAGAVRELTGGRGVDIAFDTVGAATWPVDFSAVRRGGRIVLCGVTTGAEAVTNLQALYWNQITVLGSTMGSDEDVRAMLCAVNADELHPVIDEVMPLDKAREAAERMEAGEQFGNICLRIA